ncbi:amidase signature enzyme [Tricholoma matsutake]|nr:amidase signature enzyme [Tricholoma matsutake 945]
MLTFGKKNLLAHTATNCISDFMFEEALCISSVANWPHTSDSESDLACDQPLMGVPVSLKDTVNIAGHDTTIGYSRNVAHPVVTSSVIVQLLQDAGALVHVKMTVPVSLVGLETVSDVFGHTTNPYSKEHSPSAGGGALLACGGSKIEISSDIAGSVRIPAHFCGIWSLKGSVGRFLTCGVASSMEGLEGVQIVMAPIAGSLEDLEDFWQRVVSANPWQYYHSCISLPWQPINLQQEGRKMKWGIMMDDSSIHPSLACKRALVMVVAAERQGHEVVEFQPLDVFKGLKIAYQLIFSEELRSSLTLSEKLNKASASILELLSLPRFVKKILSFFSHMSDPLLADLFDIVQPKSMVEVCKFVAQKEQYLAAWHRQWIRSGLDFVLTVLYALLAFKHGEEEKATLMSAGYTCIFSMLDYTTGILPVNFMDKEIDHLLEGIFSSTKYKSMNANAKGAYSVYDVESMHGLPLGIQVVGRRLEEEKVLEGMKVIEASLKSQGMVFVGKAKD